MMLLHISANVCVMADALMTTYLYGTQVFRDINHLLLMLFLALRGEDVLPEHVLMSHRAVYGCCTKQWYLLPQWSWTTGQLQDCCIYIRPVLLWGGEAIQGAKRVVNYHNIQYLEGFDWKVEFVFGPMAVWHMTGENKSTLMKWAVQHNRLIYRVWSATVELFLSFPPQRPMLLYQKGYKTAQIEIHVWNESK